MKAKKKAIKTGKKRKTKLKRRETPNQGQVWEFDNFIRERLKSVGIIE